ncbi:hypothetical protein GOBAR_DD02423 [Gossypium barbadense]|nr:hypothetical protein GOBAR_DD02423 [Gossypium barbadense]
MSKQGMRYQTRAHQQSLKGCDSYEWGLVVGDNFNKVIDDVEKCGGDADLKWPWIIFGSLWMILPWLMSSLIRGGSLGRIIARGIGSLGIVLADSWSWLLGFINIWMGRCWSPMLKDCVPLRQGWGASMRRRRSSIRLKGPGFIGLKRGTGTPNFFMFGLLVEIKRRIEGLQDSVGNWVSNPRGVR